MAKRGKRRVNVTLPAGPLPDTRVPLPVSTPAAAARALSFLAIQIFTYQNLQPFKSLVMQSSRARTQRHALIAVQEVAGLERQFASEFDDCDAAVNGIHIHHANGAGN